MTGLAARLGMRRSPSAVQPPPELDRVADVWPDPYGPDPVVFGSVPRIREAT